MAERARKDKPSVAPGEDGEESSDAAHPVTPFPAPVNSDRTLLIRDLGWSAAEAADTRARLRPFEEDWDALGMDAYDDL